MVKDKLINLISDELSIDKTFIYEDSNLRKLCVLSDFLKGLDGVKKKQFKISKHGLTNDNFEDVDYEDNKALIDITSFFESNENKSVIHRDPKGRDGFYNFQILEILIILSIEEEFNIQIPDDEADNFSTIGQLISYIEDAK